MEKQTASPIAGAPANGTHTPDKPKNASEHRKVRDFFIFTRKYTALSHEELRVCDVVNKSVVMM